MAKGTMSRNYFKAAFKHLFFFDTDDRESIEVAYRYAVEAAAGVGLPPTSISVWAMPRERGPWSPGRVNRGVGVIGESRLAIPKN